MLASCLLTQCETRSELAAVFCIEFPSTLVSVCESYLFLSFLNIENLRMDTEMVTKANCALGDAESSREKTLEPNRCH